MPMSNMTQTSNSFDPRAQNSSNKPSSSSQSSRNNKNSTNESPPEQPMLRVTINGRSQMIEREKVIDQMQRHVEGFDFDQHYKNRGSPPVSTLN